MGKYVLLIERVLFLEFGESQRNYICFLKGVGVLVSVYVRVFLLMSLQIVYFVFFISFERK